MPVKVRNVLFPKILQHMRQLLIKLYHTRSISIMGSTILRAHCTILLLIHVGNLSQLIQGFLVTVIIHAVNGLRVNV